MILLTQSVPQLYISLFQASRSHPRFKETFNSTEKAIDVQFASLKVVLHQEALLNLMEFANNLLPARFVACVLSCMTTAAPNPVQSASEDNLSPLYTSNGGKKLNLFWSRSPGRIIVIQITAVCVRTSIQSWPKHFSSSEEEIKPQQVKELEGSPDESEERSTAEDKKVLAKKDAQQEDEVIEVKVDARLGEFTAVITSVKGDCAELQMKRTLRSHL